MIQLVKCCFVFVICVLSANGTVQIGFNYFSQLSNLKISAMIELLRGKYTVLWFVCTMYVYIDGIFFAVVTLLMFYFVQSRVIFFVFTSINSYACVIRSIFIIHTQIHS